MSDFNNGSVANTVELIRENVTPPLTSSLSSGVANRHLRCDFTVGFCNNNDTTAM